MQERNPMPDNLSGMPQKAGRDTAAPASTMPKGPEGPPERTEDVSPEEQQIYDRFVIKSSEVMRSKAKEMAKQIREAPDPVTGAARVAGVTAQRVLAAAKKAEQQIPVDVVIHATDELFSLAVDIAERAGVHEFTSEEQDRGMMIAFDEMRVAMDSLGMLDREEAKRDLDQIKKNPQAVERMAEGVGGSPSGTGLMARAGGPPGARPDPAAGPKPTPEAGGPPIPRARA